MEHNIKKILSSSSFAVAGSFRNKSKYAYQILLMLIKQEKKVWPVNPRGGIVEGIKCYKTVLDIEEDIEAISIVTPPAITEAIVEQCREKGIYNIWMQPGAESSKAINFCRQNEINLIYNACLIIDSKK